MQAQAIQEPPTETPPNSLAGQAPDEPRPVASQPAPRQTAANRSTVTPAEPSPARILTEAFEDLRRRMATLEGRIVEGSRAGEITRIAETLEQVESKLENVAAPRRDGAGKLLVVFCTVVAFGTGIIAADYAPQLRNGSEQITLMASDLWQVASDRVGHLYAQ